MRKIWLAIVVALASMAFTAAVASGATVTTIDFTNAPTGAHFVNRTPVPTCTVSGLTVSCNSYEIAGVGNTNADLLLVANYAAIVDCFNPGVNPNNPIESHQQTFTATASQPDLAPKNGRLLVPTISVSTSTPELVDEAFCPNPNWDAVIRGGTLTLVSFTYTLTFEGFTNPVIMITGP